MKIDIYGDNISYVSDKVSSIDVTESNSSEENRAKFVTDLAAVSRGKSEANNPMNRYQKLLTEAAPTHETIDAHFIQGTPIIGSPSRPLEFLPVVLGYELQVNVITLTDTKGNVLSDAQGAIIYSIDCFTNLLGRHSFMVDGKIYTNMRALINAGVPYSVIPYNTSEELKDFIALKAQIPMFVWAQTPNTHTAISKEAQSDRVTENVNYWLPEDIKSKIISKYNKISEDDKWDEYTGDRNINSDAYLGIMLETAYQFTEVFADEDLHSALVDMFVIGIDECSFSQEEVQQFFRFLGYHKEIYNRAIYYFKYKEVVMTGWNNDPKVWQHLFLERSVKPDLWDNWTQDITMKFVKAIKNIIETY